MFAPFAIFGLLLASPPAGEPVDDSDDSDDDVDFELELDDLEDDEDAEVPEAQVPVEPPVDDDRDVDAETRTLKIVAVEETEEVRLEQSAEAVRVITTEDAKRETADLGDVLARSTGVGVRKSGGLGSSARFSLNGLGGDQVRIFVDGVPLEFSGYPFGIANIPVNLVQRVEFYQGVVPIRFGADALGGAVNIVTDDVVGGTHGGFSYQGGSFGTHRAAASLRHHHAPSGFVLRAAGFFDQAENDYRVDVEVPDEQGRLSPANVRRFHDGYRASGANLELGVVERRWADRLVGRVFVTDFEKELQHNVVMTVPYGEPTSGATAAGGSLRYAKRFRHDVDLDVVAGYGFTQRRFQDLATCIYDWFGQCIRDRPAPGEISGARDQIVDDHAVYARANAGWQIGIAHALRASVSPTYVTRTGEDFQTPEGSRDVLTAERDVTKIVTGLEYQLDVLDDRIENIAFGKHYAQIVAAEDPIAGGDFIRRDNTTTRFGVGDSIRFRMTDWMFAKGSYEYATRLPNAEELFGDAALVVANLELQPEVSHNGNVGLVVSDASTRAGAWRGGVTGFLRDVDQLIVLLGNDRVFSYQNVFRARSAGIEASAGWTSPKNYLALDANVTYQDVRNVSDEGTFGAFEGDRIPNLPYLFANGTARLQFDDVVVGRDRVSLFWTTRFVEGFFRGWESVGLAEFKQTVDRQVLHSLALTYLLQGDEVSLSFTGEVQNLADARAFDFFGVQRPGRALYFKTTMNF
ncbi:MAG: TonB-dependent siderophore myxochelin receptor MxcH [Myxococcota bacterium]